MDLKVVVERMEHLGAVKCPRCFLWTFEGRENSDHLCDRCCRVILEDFPNHEAVPGIIAAYEAQRLKWAVKKPLAGTPD